MRNMLLFVWGVAFLITGCASPLRLQRAEAPSMVLDFSSIKPPEVRGQVQEICINVYGGVYTDWQKAFGGYGKECLRAKDGSFLDTRPIVIGDLKALLKGLPVKFGVEENPCAGGRVYSLHYFAGIGNRLRFGVVSKAGKGFYGVAIRKEIDGLEKVVYRAANYAYPDEIGIKPNSEMDMAGKYLAEELAGIALYARYFLLKDLGYKDDQRLVDWVKKHGFRLYEGRGIFKHIFGVMEGPLKVKRGRIWCGEVCPGDKYLREYCESKHHKPASTPPKTARDGGSN